MINPAKGSPAAIVKVEGEKILAVVDLHLGIESWLAREGVSIPSQTPNTRERLLELIREHSPDRIFILGDLKHGIPVSSWQEWRELPALLEELMDFAELEVVKGNHDGGMEKMIPRGIKIHDARGVALGGRIGLMHGHTWPSPSLMKTSVIMVGHIHPAFEFRDKIGGRITVPVWIRCPVNREKIPKKLEKYTGAKLPKIIVIPAFSELVGHAFVNRDMPDELIGPIFRSGIANLAEADIYMIDGSFVGKLSNIKNQDTFR